MSFGSPLLMSRADLPVSVGMGAVVPCTFPERRACGGLGRPWLWRRACLVLWPSYLTRGGLARSPGMRPPFTI